MSGGNYASDRSVDDQQGDYYGSNTGVGPIRYSTFVNSNDQQVRTAAIFGSVDYESCQLTAQASARYTDFHDEFNGCLRDAGDGQLQGPSAGNSCHNCACACVTLNETISAVSIVNRSSRRIIRRGAVADWKPNEDTCSTAQRDKRLQAGSSRRCRVCSQPVHPVTQESVTAYERASSSSRSTA